MAHLERQKEPKQSYQNNTKEHTNCTQHSWLQSLSPMVEEQLRNNSKAGENKLNISTALLWLAPRCAKAGESP